MTYRTWLRRLRRCTAGNLVGPARASAPPCEWTILAAVAHASRLLGAPQFHGRLRAVCLCSARLEDLDNLCQLFDKQRTGRTCFAASVHALRQFVFKFCR